MSENNVRGKIKLLAWCFTGPLVLDALGRAWGEDLPEWIRPNIPLDRMVGLMAAFKENKEPAASDLDALAHLHTVAADRPTDHEWTRIYCHLGLHCMQHYQSMSPEKAEELRKELGLERPLDRYEMEQLESLKRDILHSSLRHLEERSRHSRKIAGIHEKPVLGEAEGPALDSANGDGAGPESPLEEVDIVFEQLSLFQGGIHEKDQ